MNRLEIKAKLKILEWLKDKTHLLYNDWCKIRSKEMELEKRLEQLENKRTTTRESYTNGRS